MFLVFCDVNRMVYSVCYHFLKCIKLPVIRTWTQQLWHSFKSSLGCYAAYKRRLCKVWLGYFFLGRLLFYLMKHIKYSNKGFFPESQNHEK